MSRLTVGVVDYGVGNLASVRCALHCLDYRCRVSRERNLLSEADVLLLPGVGAFPTAMQALHDYDLVDFLQVQARAGKPIVGICLGMQLLADESTEIQLTAGLGLIPGTVQALEFSGPRWHIGWNTIEVVSSDPIFQYCDGLSLYFNHSFTFRAPLEYISAVARINQAHEPFTIAVRRNNLVGLQFHPEKSQAAGHQLLDRVIKGVRCA